MLILLMAIQGQGILCCLRTLQIVGLNNAVERVKLEQQQLDNELDFILAQQRELEECLAPLEKELGSNGVADPEREHM
jgi:Nsp1-like C-terminal region.